ncbi:MAG: circularly permuted type 2 ATP-grasp protein [Gordonia sp. (in: high G+C Gram-positive bacteria)]
MTSAHPSAGHAETGDDRGVLSGYLPAGPARGRYDELYDESGVVRPQWEPIVDRLVELGDAGARRLDTRVGELVDDDDVTYNVMAEDDSEAQLSRTVRWRLDALPMVIAPDEWDRLARGLAQRSLLFDTVLKDFYGPQRTLRNQIVPPELVFAHPGFLRRAVGVRVPGSRALLLHGADVGRLADGSFAVVDDHTQAPSGVGYAVAGRRVLSRALPVMFRGIAPRALSAFTQNLRLALLDVAPADAEDPSIVVLSPGASSETAFDQATLASTLGVPLVEADDLTVRNGGLYMRSLGRMKRVDVVLRRVDADYTDPLDLRPDSRLGVPGLVELMTRGAVGVVNPLGSGLLENPALHAYLPQLCRALLDEDLLLNSTPAFHLGAPSGDAVLDADRHDLVLTRFASGERVVGARLTELEWAELRTRIDAEPQFWCAKRLVDFSQAPSLLPGDGEVSARGFALRAFTVAQESGYAVLSGGLGQVLSDGPDGRLLSSSAAKDVWVPISEEVRTGVRVATVPARRALAPATPAVTPRMLSNMFWMGRYADRAEALVRLLSVARDRDEQYRNRPWQPGSRALQPLLDAVFAVSGVPFGFTSLRAEGPQATDVLAGLTALTVDDRVPGTVGHSVASLAEAARAVRDQMSMTTWKVLSGGERALATLAGVVDDDGVRLDEALTELLASLLAFAGLAHESLVRDPGWLMMDIGRRIERTLGLVALTREVVVPVTDPETESALLDAYLVTSESSVTHRRLYPGPARPRTAMELMLFDETNPRSAIFQLTTLRADFAGLPDELRSGTTERIVEDLITTLRRFDALDVDSVDEGRRTELDKLLASLREGLREVSDVLERTRFAPQVAARPLWAGTVQGGQ